MPATRRLVYVVIGLVFLIIYLRTSAGRSSLSPTDFYSRTSSRLNADGYKIEPVRGSSSTKKLSTEDADSEAMSSRLREAESLAKDNANKKAPSREAVMGDVDEPNFDKHSYHAGIQELATEDPKNPNIANVPAPPQPSQNRSLRKKPDGEVKKKTPQEMEEDSAVKDVLNDLLKMAPSKSIPSHSYHLSYKLTTHSHHILQILLPILRQSQALPHRSLQDRATALRCRVRSHRTRLLNPTSPR